MDTHNKPQYECPRVLQMQEVGLEHDLLFGSITDWIYPVETAGSEVDNVYDCFSDNTFNHEWKD